MSQNKIDEDKLESIIKNMKMTDLFQMKEKGRVVVGLFVNSEILNYNAKDSKVEKHGLTIEVGVKGDLTGIVKAIRLSRATMGNIRQNLFFAFIYNSLGVPVAAGVLYPVFGLLLSPMIAAAAMSLSSVSVIANALRLRRVKL